MSGIATTALGPGHGNRMSLRRSNTHPGRRPRSRDIKQ